ncbi:DUF624 domain-containing protein [Cellulomonas uda]|uniref:DUF624 domain-containing protein n=1 Tax=Cellulomonas uda TaxID=1714 RepID=A0A4Y3K9Y6_CELUD|nr:DUF624 domain-containing protein [Cellulomonas uda]NII65177.1 hypothetical protein [Cellulomonas uda]GEA80224.1 hypothetical protein CUD01_06680 [Cellulomonas uda]
MTVADRSTPASEIGRGPLSRWSAAVYWALVIELLIVLTSLPGLLALALLDRSVSNAPLVALCLVPLGPALGAATYAWRAYLVSPPDQRDLTPASWFWRGYRLSWRDVLAWWVPMLVVLALLAVDVLHAGAVVGQGWAVASLVVAVALLVWAGNALVLSSLFAFRTRDVVRLAAYYLAARPVAALGNLTLVVLGATLATVTTDRLVLALATLAVASLVRTATPVVADVTARFTSPTD